MKTAVVTDSNSGIFHEEAAQLGIHCVGMPILVNGAPKTEGVDITAEELFEYMESGVPVTTSQPAPGTVTGLWNQLLAKGYDNIAYIPMSSSLSHSCDSALMLAANYSGKVSVVDNRSISFSQRASVMEAIKMADEGMPAAHIKSALELHSDESSIYLAVDTLDYLVRGGRVTPATAKLASLLKIKPIMSLQGGLLEPYAKERGMKKALKKMLAAVKLDAKKKLSAQKIDDLLVGVACVGLSRAEEMNLVSLISQEFPGAEVAFDRLPLSIAAHTGPGAAGFGVHTKLN